MNRRVLLTTVPLTLWLALSTLDSGFLAATDEKITAQELIAKHLEAIGTPAARAAVKNRTMNGTAQVVFRGEGSRGRLTGKCMIASEGRNYRLGISFASQEYSGEQVAFNGSTVTAGQIRPGVRSELTNFLYQTDFLLKEGLVGGLTSTNWIFLDLAGRQSKPKIEYTGVKNVEGKKLHELKYEWGKGGVTARSYFYFDPVTFQHMLSVHNYRNPMVFAGNAIFGGRTVDLDPMEGICEIREEFSSFKAVDGLMLPNLYKLEFLQELQFASSPDRVSVPFLAEWTMNFAEVLHNKRLDASMFKLQ